MMETLIGPRGSRRGAWDSGAAAVELSFLLPVLVVLGLGVSDYGALMGSAASLEAATRSVAEYARNSAACAAGGLANSDCITGINSLVTTLKSNNTAISSATFTPSSVQANAANYCTCTDGSGSSVGCSTLTCSVGSPPDTRVLQYIQIVANQTYTPLVSYAGFFSSFPATGQTTIRIQ
jgi:Flp pilus assembly protein TadG